MGGRPGTGAGVGPGGGENAPFTYRDEHMSHWFSLSFPGHEQVFWHLLRVHKVAHFPAAFLAAQSLRQSLHALVS